jgi:hypothetical protein
MARGNGFSGYIQSSLTFGTPYYLNSGGTYYGTLQNDANEKWSLGYSNLNNGSLGTSVLNWGASGNVGIGTTTPTEKLEVAGNGKFSGYVYGNLFSGGGYPYTTELGSGADVTTTILKAGSTSGYQSTIVLNGGTSTLPNTITFSTSSVERIKIDASGNMGIGIVAPTEKLSVNGTIQAINQSTTDPGIRAICNTPLSSNSYSRGNFEARVYTSEYESGVRPGYGFHAVGYYGSFLYAAGGLDLRIKSQGGDEATLLTTANFQPSNYFPFTGGNITGDVAIGTTVAQKDLAVNGNIKTRKVKVTFTDWPDYVFDSSYQLTSLPQLKKYIQQNKHLPDVVSAAKVKKEGLDLGENQAVLLKKIEELTLYIISQNEKLEEQGNQIKALQEKIK